MKKSALLTVFVVVLIDLMGFGMVLPHLAFYAGEFDASPVAIGVLYSVYSFAQLIFAPIWGSISDRVGRRPIMMLSTFGAASAYLLFAWSNSLALLFASRILAGIMAGNISTAQAYVADVTDSSNRARGMGLIGAAFGIGFVIGPAIGAVLMHFGTYALLGYFAAALSATSFIMVWAALPESRHPSVSSDATRIVRHSVFTKAFWTDLRVEGRGHGILPWLFAGAFILAFGQSSIYGAFPLFCKEQLGLTPVQVGAQYVWMGLVAAFIQGGMIRSLDKRFGEKPILLAGAIIMCCGFIVLPLAFNFLSLTGYLIIMAIGGSLATPTLISLVSKQSPPEKYGTILGASQGLSALGRATGPAWGGILYSAHPSAPFWATAGVLTVLIFISLKIMD